MDRKRAEFWMDDPEYAGRFISNIEAANPAPLHGAGQGHPGSFLRDVFGSKPLFQGRFEAPGWAGGCIVKNAPRSHFDLLIKQVRKGRTLPSPLFCIAGSSEHCHGQRDRPWSALDGNLHMAVLFQPERSVPNFGPGFLALAAVSVVETLDGLDGYRNRAGIKWVNDILIDGAKVAGFLVHTLGTGSLVQAAVLGLGLNIEANPDIAPDPFVSRAASLRDLGSGASGITRKDVVLPLLKHLGANYRRLLDGQAGGLIEAYRSRSVVAGKKGKVLADPAFPGEKMETYAVGVVEGVGPNLELLFQGQNKAITRGRLVILE